VVAVKTFVIVPVKDQWQQTRAFLGSLDADEVDDVLVMDNGSTDETAQRIREMQRSRYFPWRSKLHRSSMPELLIYDMWNAGFARAAKLAGREDFYVLVSNNDVVLPRGAIPILRSALQFENHWASYPDYDAEWRLDAPPACTLRYTRGVLSDRGLFGACFMLAGHRIPWRPLVSDTGYYWWYGDNHLAEQVELEGGRQVRCEGLSVQHVNEATARDWPHLDAWKYHDRQRWITRHQRWEQA
jgi:GT2 family glycosyltransferase